MGLLCIYVAINRPESYDLPYLVYLAITAVFFIFQHDIKIKAAGAIAALCGIAGVYMFSGPETEAVVIHHILLKSAKLLHIACIGLLIGQSKTYKVQRYAAVAVLITMLYFMVSKSFPLWSGESHHEYDIINEKRLTNEYISYLLTFLAWIPMPLLFRKGSIEKSAEKVAPTPPPIHIEKPVTPHVQVQEHHIQDNDDTQVLVQDTETNRSDLIPDTLLQGGKYKILGTLGQGGFGITYLAMQTALNRKVAVKEFFMKEHCERNETGTHVTMGTSGSRDMVGRFKAKFIKEAQTIAVMDNHHIVRIFDIFEENGTAYYVMEYLEGGDLLSQIHDGTCLSEETALKYIRQICEALDFIHMRNILHLDVKPGNILFRSNGETVLIDFGISKHYDEEGGSQTSSTPVGISQGYAPLEQYQRGGIVSFSPSTDIYSVGATLYRLVTGKVPPSANTVYEDGLGDLGNLSDKVRNAICRAMEPRRRDRPQTISEFLGLLA